MSRQSRSEGSAFTNGGGGFCSISNISKERQNVSVVGLLISKEGPKTVMNKKGIERHLIAFTVRDEPMAYINVTCCGSMDYVQNLAQTFNIGDVAEIQGAQSQAKSTNPMDEKFKPWTPGSFQLSVSENHSSMLPYRGPDVSSYINLLHVPIRANNDFYTLEDIMENGMNLQGEHINILALVKKIWPVREIQTKLGKSTSKVDIILCDETCANFYLTLWDNFVSLVEHWTPLETVLFAADVRVNYNDYRSTMTACSDSKTVFTVDPASNEANALRQFGRGQGMFNTGFSSEGVPENDPDIDSIRDILTVQEIKKLQRDMSSVGESNIYCIIYAFVSSCDVDGATKPILKHTCARCGKQVDVSSDFECTNPECAKDQSGDVHCQYNLMINLTDHTGTLRSCRVPSQIAEEMLGYKASDLKYLPESSRTHIKWEHLFERIKAIIKVKCHKSGRYSVQAMALTKVDSAELADKGFQT